MNDPDAKTQGRPLATLCLGTLLFWVIVAYPAWRLGGLAMAVFSAIAAGLCLLPTALTLLWARWALEQEPGQQLALVLGGTGLRILVVLGLGAVLYSSIPYLQQKGVNAFWTWLLVFYLFTLALESVLLLSRAKR